MAKIIILGGGFAALSVAESLASSANPEHEIVLVSKSAEFTFYPAIVPMVFGDFEPDDLRFDIRPELAARHIQFVQGEVRRINTKRRTVVVAGEQVNRTLDFDFLVMAMGPRVVARLVPGLRRRAHHLMSVD